MKLITIIIIIGVLIFILLNTYVISQIENITSDDYIDYWMSYAGVVIVDPDKNTEVKQGEKVLVS